MEGKNSLSTGHLIEKSKKLVWAKFKDWRACDLRLLEVYLSRIDARDPESSNVRFTLREYAELIGSSDLRKEQVQASTRKFLGNVVTIRGEEDENEWAMYTLFTVAHCFKDKKLGQYVIEIDCNPQVKDVFFSLAQDGYIKYRLQNTVKMSSQYSVQLYGLMLDMMHVKGGWTIRLDKLKNQIGATAKWYDSFLHFRKDVLEPSLKEINEKTDINVDYQRIMTGRKCTAIHFVASKKQVEPTKASNKEDNKPNPYAECLTDLEPTQAKRIGDMVKRKIKALYPDLDADKVDAATLGALKNAQKKLLDENNDYPRNPAGYVWSVLSKDTAIDEFIPGDILFGM